MKGSLDEVRISNTARSADWIKASYLSQNGSFAFTSFSTDPPAIWWDTDWLDATKITFDNSASSEDLLNFPVLVSLTTAEVDFSKIQANGADIRFVDDDGTLLDYEIEAWDDTPGSESATAFRKAA